MAAAAYAEVAAPVEGKSWLAGTQWKAGEKAIYQVQQVVKERKDGKEETRFLSNGLLQIEVHEATDQFVEFSWHRHMDNGELELVREPWGIRGNPRMERMVGGMVREGFPIRAKYEFASRRLIVVDAGQVSETLAKRMSAIGGEFGQRSNQYARKRPATPDELQAGRTPSNAQLGIHQPLVKYDSRAYTESPRWGYAVGAWYVNISTPEMRDFLAWQTLEYTHDSTPPATGGISRRWKDLGGNEVLLSITRPEVLLSEPLQATSNQSDEPPTQPAFTGLAGGIARPTVLDAKMEISFPSGWPKRAAIVRAEDNTTGTRTTMRRVYLRQTP